MAASIKLTESARYQPEYKGNFFPNFTVSGTGLTVMPTVSTA